MDDKAALGIEAYAHANARKYIRILDEDFDKTQAQIERDLIYWFALFAEKNDISYHSAAKVLTPDVLKKFIQTYDYIEPDVEKRKAEKKQDLTWLAAAYLLLFHSLDSHFDKEAEETKKAAAEAYSESYYRTTYEEQRATGSWDFGVNAPPDVDFGGEVWAADGLSLDARIKKYRAEAKTAARKALAAAISRESVKTADETPALPADITKPVTKAIEPYKQTSRTRINTETAAFHARGTREVYEAMGVKKYEILATLDMRTCEHCGAKDGLVFKLADWSRGTTAPPFHPNCRCTTKPVTEQAGETYDETASLKYEKWRENIEAGRTGNIQGNKSSGQKSRGKV